MGHKLKIAGWISVGALAGALTTVSLQTMARNAMAPLPLEEIQQLSAVFGLIKTDYVEPVDDKKLITDAISGMVSGLDPHSQYFDKKSFKEFREGTSGRFVGVGIEITQEDGLVKVVSPIEGSPAFRAGLKTNDLITKIDDTAVKGLSLNEAVKRMRGEPNTKVTLTIFRKDESRTFTVTITREEIKTQSVKSKIVEPGYAWVRLSQFQERTVEDFVRKVQEIYQQEPRLKGMVLDLRNDPGGLLDAAVAISAAFLPANVTVVSTNGQLPESKATFTASPDVLRVAAAARIRSSACRWRSRPCRWWCWSTRARPRRARSSPAPCRTTSAPPCWAARPSARARCRPCARSGRTRASRSLRRVTTRPAAALSRPRASCPTSWWTSPKTAICSPRCACAKPTSTSTSATARTATKAKTLTADKAQEQAREQAREEALKRLECEAKKPEAERKLPEFGSDKDFQLQQALNQLKGLPVKVSKTLTERKEEKKDKDE